MSRGMCLMGFRVKDQGHNALITENGLCRIIAFPLHLSLWNFIQRLPMSRWCALWISGSKVKVTMHWELKMVYVAQLLSLYTFLYHHETSYKDSPWVYDVPYGFRGQNIKDQGHIALISDIHVNLLPQKCWRNLLENWLKNWRILSVFDM